jgi:hypothetical protein
MKIKYKESNFAIPRDNLPDKLPFLFNNTIQKKVILLIEIVLKEKMTLIYMS